MFINLQSGLVEGNILSDTNVYGYYMLGTSYESVALNNEWWRIFTYGFVHADIMHLLFNMIALYSLADAVVSFTSTRFALLTYFIALIISGLGATFLAPDTATVGASGAIYGLFGILIYFAIKLSRQGYHDMFRSLAPVIVINLMITIMPGVSLVGHLAGLVAGLVASFIYDKKFRNRYYR